MFRNAASQPISALSARTERHLLQAAIAAAGFVPVLAGLDGALLGSAMTGEGAISIALDTEIRTLSGLLLGIGLAYWEAIPRIERHTERVRLLTGLVVLAGLMRLIAVVFPGGATKPALFGLAMELIVAPALCLWQARIARRCGMHL